MQHIKDGIDPVTGAEASAEKKPKCLLTVDVEALPMRAPGRQVDTLIYGRFGNGEWGIGRMMDLADRHGVKMTFFLDVAEAALYGGEIIQAGQYIASRGHDLQIHCHYELFGPAVEARFPRADADYRTWYEDEEISAFIVDYCVEQYRKCTPAAPAVFRGGAYCFGEPLLRVLKKRGFAADASYHMLRPKQLPPSGQFVYENGLRELPISVLPGRRRHLNFNLDSLYPTSERNWEQLLDEYGHWFQDLQMLYGDDAVNTMMMHSWSFCYDRERFQETGFIDRPNPYAADFFDRFLDRFCGKIDFITAAQAAQLDDAYFTKTTDFGSVFSTFPHQDRKTLLGIEAAIEGRRNGRELVIWGTGSVEQQMNEALPLGSRLDAACYISRNPSIRTWRGKPVKPFEDAALSPERHYVLLAAKASFSEIRGKLEQAGFAEYADFFDINRPVPQEDGTILERREGPPCPICGGTEYERYNSPRYRRCPGCGSTERNRAIPRLFAENLGPELLSQKILHVSPIRSERLYFRQAGAGNITTLDIRPQVKPDLVADLCRMPQVESDCFDVVFASCVLNHVYDDEAALAEIHRVLRQKGLFIAYVMGSGGMKTTYEADPTEWYGKEAMDAYRVGIYRYYGETDFTAQLKRHFSKVHSYEKYDAPSGLSSCWYVCEK